MLSELQRLCNDVSQLVHLEVHKAKTIELISEYHKLYYKHNHDELYMHNQQSHRERVFNIRWLNDFGWHIDDLHIFTRVFYGTCTFHDNGIVLPLAYVYTSGQTNPYGYNSSVDYVSISNQ